MRDPELIARHIARGYPVFTLGLSTADPVVRAARGIVRAWRDLALLKAARGDPLPILTRDAAREGRWGFA